MICEICRQLTEDCECEKDDNIDIDYGDDEWIHGYDGDCL